MWRGQPAGRGPCGRVSRQEEGHVEGSAGRKRAMWRGQPTERGPCGGVSQQVEGHVEGSAGR